MKLIIEIPESRYKDIQRIAEVQHDNRHFKTAEQIIAKGVPLEQEPKTGHWNIVSDGYGDNAYICECSECKDTVWVYKDADRKWNYCPNCGARMESEVDNE